MAFPVVPDAPVSGVRATTAVLLPGRLRTISRASSGTMLRSASRATVVAILVLLLGCNVIAYSLQISIPSNDDRARGSRLVALTYHSGICSFEKWKRFLAELSILPPSRRH